MRPKRNNIDSVLMTDNIESEQLPEPEARPSFIKTRIIIMLASFVIGSLGFYEKMAPKVTPSFSDINLVPIEQGTPAVLGSSNEKDSPLDAYYPQLEKYDQMTIEEFERQPLGDRLAFSQYLIDKTGQSRIYKKYYGVGTENHDFATGLSPVSDRTPDWIILDNYLHIRQLSMLQFDKNSSDISLLDKTNSKKMLSSIYYKTDDHTPQQYNNLKSNIDLIEKPEIIATRFAAIDSTPLLHGEKTINSQIEQTTYKEMEFYDRETVCSFYTRFFLVRFNNYDGTEKEIWLLDAISKHKDNLAPIN